MYGAVYVFENPEAKLVKIGMTINHVADRLRTVNDMWRGRRVTCQVCGARRLTTDRGLVPRHPSSQHGSPCPGSSALPVEKDVSIAEAHLEKLKKRHSELSGNERASATRMIRNLERRVELYRHHARRVGAWQFRIAFLTKCAEQVELLSHEILAEHLDRQAPFGEVFRCSVSEATEAIEATLSRLELLHSSRKETRLRQAHTRGFTPSATSPRVD
jgi:hypothetical protein